MTYVLQVFLIVLVEYLRCQIYVSSITGQTIA